MKAIILAAGISRRLRPLTNDKPKCLLEINNKTIISYQIEVLKKYGIEEIVVIIGYNRVELINFLNKKKIKYIINYDYKTTNSSYSLWLSREELIGHDFIYLNSDLIFSEDIINKLIINASKFSCIIDKSRLNKDKDSFKAIIDSSRIISMDKNINSDIEVPGPFYVNEQTSIKLFNKLKKIITNNKSKWVYSIFDELSKSIDLKGIYTTSPWIEIDTEHDYNEAKEIFSKII